MEKKGITARPNPDAETAAQYLIWALELIETCGAPRAAASHARLALQELRGTLIEEVAITPNHYGEEAKRFGHKADEAEQMAELATSSRRDALMRTVESYRTISEQMQLLSKAVN